MVLERERERERDKQTDSKGVMTNIFDIIIL